MAKLAALPTQAEALPGRAQALSVPSAHYVTGARSSRRLRPGLRGGVRHGLLLGAGGILAGAGRGFHQRRLCGRPHAQPDL